MPDDTRKVDPTIDPPNPGPGPDPDPPRPQTMLPRRYHGTLEVAPTHVGRDASRIAQVVVAHLVALADADVTVTIEFEAKLPKAATNHPIRPVTQTTRTRNFTPASASASASERD